MSIQIRQTYAQIGIETTPARLELESRMAKLEFVQKHAKVNIHTEHTKVQIDSYEARASAGLKNNGDIIREAAQRGHQQAIACIGQIASDGNRLAAIEKGGSPIAEMAVRDAYPQKEFGLDYIPKTGPKITVTGGVEYDPEENGQGVNNGVEGTFIPGSLNGDYIPYHVNIYLRQKAAVSISYTGSKVDASI